MSEPYVYAGQELDIFAHARNWKGYWSGRIRPWIRGRVLEVGAGLGANTAMMQSPAVSFWTCLEPDAALADRLRSNLRDDPALRHCTARVGSTADLAPGSYDSILYIDVLEHIKDDVRELAVASSLLAPGGAIVVLSPAHQWLFSPFDAAIGHFRRYNRASLSACSPPGCVLREIYYLDSVGLLASAANRLMLRQSSPTLEQILLWDGKLVPLSVRLDPVLRYRAGKSIVAVWCRS
jgi:hypothetical protein